MATGGESIPHAPASTTTALALNSDCLLWRRYAIGVPKSFQNGHSVIPGPKPDVVQQVELWMLGIQPLMPLAVHAGVPLIVLLGVTTALYVGVGVLIGANKSGNPFGLEAHPHFEQWRELLGLASDGVAFAVSGVVGHGQSRHLGLQSGMDRSLLRGNELPVAGRPPTFSKHDKLSKREQRRQIEKSDARIAQLLAQEQARSQRVQPLCAAVTGVEERFETGGQHQSQARVCVRGAGRDENDDEDLELNLD